MRRNELPRFVIYQPNKKEFHICIEVGGKFFRWCSYYPPTLDVRFAREVTRIKDVPLKSKPRKNIYDEGTYSITQSKKDTKEAIENKLAKGLENKSFSFVLNGKIFKGRFAFKRYRNSIVLQKFKDKYAKEEDVLSGDLIRTINTMVPDYDESKVKVNYSPKTKPKKVHEPHPIEDVTADTTIGNIAYHFVFYTSDDGAEICLVTSAEDEVLVLKRERDKWILLSPANRAALRKAKEFTKHAEILYENK